MKKLCCRSPDLSKGKSRRGDRLAVDITVTLVIKLILIYVLWYAFFSEPIDEHLTGQTVGDVLFGPLSGSSHDNQMETR